VSSPEEKITDEQALRRLFREVSEMEKKFKRFFEEQERLNMVLPDEMSEEDRRKIGKTQKDGQVTQTHPVE